MSYWDIKKYLDPKWKYFILKVAIDDVNDEFWACTETEEQAKERVHYETQAYGDVPEFQFRYERI